MQRKINFKLKWIGWESDKHTGVYPLPRILWNFLWYLPVQISRFALVATVFCARGSDMAKEVYNFSF